MIQKNFTTQKVNSEIQVHMKVDDIEFFIDFNDCYRTMNPHSETPEVITHIDKYIKRLPAKELDNLRYIMSQYFSLVRQKTEQNLLEEFEELQEENNQLKNRLELSGNILFD